MTKLNHYIIYFSGLKDGKHDYEFTINKELFAFYGENEISDGSISIHAILEKKSDHLAFHFDIKGTVITTCDRCLGPLVLEVNDSPELYVSFGEITSDLTDIDDTMILSKSEDKIDLSKHFYDYVVLNLPIKKIHPEDENGESTCNPEMLKKIQEYELNENTETDPRWDKLKDLLN